jgi:putative transposase
VVPATTFATRAAAEAALFRYMTAGFNQRRIQAGLDGLSPDEYEHAWKASRPHPQPATLQPDTADPR